MLYSLAVLSISTHLILTVYGVHKSYGMESKLMGWLYMKYNLYRLLIPNKWTRNTVALNIINAFRNRKREGVREREKCLFEKTCKLPQIRINDCSVCECKAQMGEK